VVTLAVYCALVFVSSWLGGVLPSLMKLTHTRLQLLISLIGGLMLGVGMLHQLPHAVAALTDAGVEHPLDLGLIWMLVGLTAMFFLLRMFHFHSHDSFDEPAPANAAVHHHHDHDGGHQHDHDHDHGHTGKTAAQSWIGLAFGLSVHTLTDGLALAAHVEADLGHHAATWLPGLGTFLGIALHKPLDSLSITSLMSAAGASVNSRRLLNCGYALLCPLGAMLFQLGVRSLTTQQHLVVGAALAFSAGVFVCIALSDLLPEVQFHSHDRVWLSLALTAGLVLAWLIGFVEPEHSHGAPANPAIHSHPVDDHHSGHSHPH
jgi:zinc and cadmium transporter